MNDIKSIFIFSKIERIGLYVILGLILLTIGLKVYIRHNLKSSQTLSYNEKLAEFEQQITNLRQNITTDKRNSAIPPQNNTTITSYQDTGKAKNNKQKINSYSKKLPIKININTADTSQWKKLYGIGKVLSKRIVNFREKLGGFYSIEQMEEVYGLKPETFESIRPHLILDSNYVVKKIDLNNSTIKKLAAHPYIDWDLASLIVAYRKQHNGFKTVYELRSTDLVNEKLYRKLAPYLIVKKYAINEN